MKDKRPNEVPESEKQDQNSSKRCSASQDITEMLTLKGCHEFVPRTRIVHMNLVTDIIVTGMITFHYLMGKLVDQSGDRKSTRLNSSHFARSRMPSSA